MTESKWRGHLITEVGPADWRYEDSIPVKDDPRRPCGHCGKEDTPAGHDGCIGTLPGVMNACCGHGVASEAYVQLGNRGFIRGQEALSLIDKLKPTFIEKETL